MRLNKAFYLFCAAWVIFYRDPATAEKLGVSLPHRNWVGHKGDVWDAPTRESKPNSYHFRPKRAVGPPQENSNVIRLEQAIIGNDLSEVERLIKAGVSPDQVCDRYCLEPLIKASGQGKVEMVEFLLKSGANPNQIDSSGSTALMKTAGRAGSGAKSEILNLLLSYNADLEAQDYEGRNALMLADDVTAATLLERGATVEATDSAGFRAVSWAVLQRREEKLKHLISKGAALNFRIQAGSHQVYFSYRRSQCEEADSAKWMAAALVPLILLDPTFYLSPDCKSKVGTVSEKKYPKGYTTLDLAKEMNYSPITALLKDSGAKTSKQLGTRP